MLNSTSEDSGIDESVSDPPGRWIEGLSPEMPLLDALEVIFRQRFQGVRYYLPLAADHAGEDSGHIHKLRVSCRRLSAVLDVLADGFPEAPRQRLLKTVQKIRRTCGKARDLDVRREFLESLLKLASVEDAAVVELLCEMTVCRRERAQQKVQRRLEKLSPELHDSGAELVSSLRTVQRDAGGGYATFGKTGCRILSKELAGLWDLAARDLESTATLHQLRIACKHLRYAVEVFMPVLPEAFRADFYPQLEDIQRLLGDFHDADEAIRSFRKLKKRWKRWRGTKKWDRRGLSGFRWSELRAGVDAVLLAYVQHSDQARTEFLDLWPGFSGDSFRKPVGELLGALTEPVESEAAAMPGQGDVKDDEHLLPN